VTPDLLNHLIGPRGKVFRTEGELRRKAADASVDGVGQLTGGLGGPPRYARRDLGGPAPRLGLAHPPDTGVHGPPLPWMWLDGGGA